MRHLDMVRNSFAEYGNQTLGKEESRRTEKKAQRQPRKFNIRVGFHSGDSTIGAHHSFMLLI